MQANKQLTADIRQVICECDAHCCSSQQPHTIVSFQAFVFPAKIFSANFVVKRTSSVDCPATKQCEILWQRFLLARADYPINIYSLSFKTPTNFLKEEIRNKIMTKIGRNNIVLNSLSAMTYCEVNKSIRIFKFLLHRCDRNYRCRIR